MYKYIATRSCLNPGEEQCNQACVEAKQPGWGDTDHVWRSVDECNRCAARDYRSERYTDPYYYIPPWGKRTLATTPAISKQFTANVCGVNMDNAYKNQLLGYDKCKECAESNMCYSTFQRKCVKCTDGTSPGRCEEEYGCPNPNGSQFGYVPPKDPMFTDCRPCWAQL